jgi:nicotinamidase-related amidase
VPEKTALLIVDMLNPYDHEDAEALVPNVERVIEPMAELIDRGRCEGVDLVWVNDNYGDWSASGKDLVDSALNGERPDLIEPIIPPDDEDFIVKARHSVFYTTPLDYMLGQRDIDHIVLAGQVTEQCILYSALDAYVRHFEVTVPADAVAHIDEDLARAALKMMEENMDAEITSCDQCTLVGA